MIYPKLLSIALLSSIFVCAVSIQPVTGATTVALDLGEVSQLTGEATFDNVGTAVASAGDVNGDNYDDMLFGVPSSDVSGSGAGAAYLVYGRSTTLTSESLAGSSNTVVEFTGEADSDLVGYAVAGAGDVNNDGYDDILIGAPHISGDVTSRAYLVYGRASTLTSESLGGSSNTVVEFTSENTGEQVGYSVATAGDVNNDGFDDILISAPRSTGGGTTRGSTYLIYGRSTSLTSEALDESSNTVVRFTGAENGNNAGESVAGVGDVNNDGFDDIIIGAPGNDSGGANVGAAYVIYGRSTILTAESVSGSSNTVARLTGEAANHEVGAFVSAAGDVNNDGYDDILLGTHRYDVGGAFTGAAYVVYGRSSILATEALSGVNNAVVRFAGAAAGDQVGKVAAASDVNNDGYDDIIIGAKYNDTGGLNTGTAYLVFGQAANLVDELLGESNNITLAFTGKIVETYNDEAGTSVAGAGDINNDGYPDILIGAPNNSDDGMEYAGAVYIVNYDQSAITITSNTTEQNIVECNSEVYSDAGATAMDQYADTALAIATLGAVTEETLGDYAITYSTNNLFNVSSTALRTVTVTDTIAPIIMRTGAPSITIQEGSTYIDAGATATDSCDNTVPVITTGSVDTNVPGFYVITYTATDDSGNAATPQTRIVSVLADDGFMIEEEESVESAEISSIAKAGAMLMITYSDNSSDTINPFNGKKAFVYTLSKDNRRVLVTNGKKLKVYVAGEQVTSKQVNNKKPAKKAFYQLKNKKLYSSAEYESVVFINGKKTQGKIVVFRLTAGNELKKKRTDKQPITKRDSIMIDFNKDKKRIITKFGTGAKKTKIAWQLTELGKLKLQ